MRSTRLSRMKAIVEEAQRLLSSPALVRNMNVEAMTRSTMQPEDADAAGY